jgi:hypothetical protein
MTRTNRCALCCLAQEKIHPTQLRFKFLITTSSNSILSYSILFYFIVLCSTPVLCPALLCFCLVPCSAWLCPARLYSTCSHSYSYSSSSSSILFLFYSYFHACFYFHSYFYSYFFPTSPRLLLLFYSYSTQRAIPLQRNFLWSLFAVPSVRNLGLFLVWKVRNVAIWDYRAF